MRLAGVLPATDPRDRLASAAHAILDRRLLRDSGRPVAVAFSGGGDSLALLRLADAWARSAGRRLLVLTVDHRLQPASATWTTACAAAAARLSADFQALAWNGPKPAHGLPAAARAARHQLLADAARQAGARVILMGHTADDVLEARVMRGAGSTTPDPRAWTPSPAWPEGRSVFLLRPLLAVRRAEIRDWLAARHEHWIEDPANADLRFARVRARAQIDAAPQALEPVPEAALAIADRVRVDAVGGLHIPRAELKAAPAEATLRFLSLACVCAGGGDRRPATPRLQRLTAAIRSDREVAATLAGARIEANDREVHILREAGEAARGGLAALTLPAQTPTVWDGRFELEARHEGLQVRRLAGLARRLPQNQQRALRDLHPSARPGLPAVVAPSGAVSCSLLGDDGEVTVRLLVHDRLVAPAGLVAREPA